MAYSAPDQVTLRSSRSQDSHGEAHPHQMSDEATYPRHSSTTNAMCHEAQSSCDSSAAETTSEAAPDVAWIVHKWPVKPQFLRQTTALSVLATVAEGLLGLAPLAFIALGITMKTLDGQPTKGNALGKKVEAIAKLGPTLFPILFVAVASRSLKTLGRRLCQTGARLGTIELLFASRSVWGTIESQLLLRRATVLGGLLLLFWGLSPLGGQASLRALHKANRYTSNSTELRYLHTGRSSAIYKPVLGYSMNSDQLYITALSTSKELKLAPRDNLGNVRVPRLELLVGPPPPTPRVAAWLPVPAITLPEQYASLLGIPVVGVPAGVASDFSLEVSYLALSCSPWDVFATAGRDGGWTKYFGQVWGKQGRNDSLLPFRRHNPTNKRMGYVDMSFFLDTDLPFGRSNATSHGQQQQRRRHLHFGSVVRSRNYSVGVSSCAVSAVYAEVAVHCPSGPSDCRAVRMRPSLLAGPPELFAPLEFAPTAKELLTKLPLAAPNNEPGYNMSPTESVLNDTLRLTFVGAEFAPTVNLTRLTAAELSSRLALVVNTYYMSVMPGGGSRAFGEPPRNLSLFGYDYADELRGLQRPPTTNKTHRTGGCPIFCSCVARAALTAVDEVYRTNAVWLALLFASAAALLAAGLAGSLVSRKTLVPDMLGYVTSMTYDNPHLALTDHPGGKDADVIDAMERARVLQDLPVQVGDICGAEDVGHIAFTSGANIRRLEMNRAYS